MRVCGMDTPFTTTRPPAAADGRLGDFSAASGRAFEAGGLEVETEDRTGAVEQFAGRGHLIIEAPAHADGARGTFSLRSPLRPNPIALSVVQLLKVEDTRLSVIGLDCLDGTPLIDLKPYFATTDAIPDAQVRRR